MIEFMLFALLPLIGILIFCLCSFAFAEYIAFGYQDIYSQSVAVSFASRVVETFDSIDYVRLQSYDRVMGTLWSVVFVVFLGVLILNLIIAVLTHQYENAREQVGKRHWAHHQYNSVMFHWILKKERKRRADAVWKCLCCRKGSTKTSIESKRSEKAKCCKCCNDIANKCEEFYGSCTSGAISCCTKCYNWWMIPASKRYMQHVTELNLRSNLTKLQRNVNREQKVESSMHRLPSLRTIPDDDTSCCGMRRKCYEFDEWCKHMCRHCCDNEEIDDMDVLAASDGNLLMDEKEIGHTGIANNDVDDLPRLHDGASEW
eukprot:CAMPEP_0184495920 /NCGR_PEP_ID=MMETSP0113_2-20130426/32676_1 /TAXON_ID=91329 /ORGANISM="Norrisiella sphaerica, Strain BC52" /LENGTH=315 /DNA_ID=CAMNT_0026882337 /DNA_START=215 /DNA_END=1162 /DNA_ORIENTATION=-